MKVSPGFLSFLSSLLPSIECSLLTLLAGIDLNRNRSTLSTCPAQRASRKTSTSPLSTSPSAQTESCSSLALVVY
jgi:hypothetical protein